MKAVLISIQPKWCELIASGRKTIEVRKTCPKLEPPFNSYIYCTGVKNMSLSEYVEIHKRTGGKIDDWQGKVIGEYVCDEIISDKHGENVDILCKKGCLTLDELKAYSPKGILYGQHISDLVIYDEPKELGDFKPFNRECKFSDLGFAIPKCDECHYCKVERPPQSWCYVVTK